MDKLIQEIYKLKHNPIVTPNNLLENIKLNNYNYVKCFKDEKTKYLNVEMECVCADSVKRVFVYEFNKKDWVQRIIVKYPEYEVFFDREGELEVLLLKYKEEKKSLIKKYAI